MRTHQFPVITPTSTLPQIVEILGCDDHGSCEGGFTANCPHCGAGGRYVYTFRCADGSTHSAMRGCIQLYPRHKFARYMQALAEKTMEQKPLNKWDLAIEEAIHEWLAGTITERRAESDINLQINSRRAWMKRRFR